ncbi:MYND finger domain containing protein [Nitzschia inconspicua]|uniref:MYND finger domain containing protein n=1 Tax=Nitzschia inconspicua TaxID=303405 RepID=A0A9K3L575_9STRA|nr:MYND finger domain containing protein [Nitzschia inconspicua]
MVFLILSNRYPTDTHRQRYLHDAGRHAKQVSPFHKHLAASADDDQWRDVLNAIRDNTDASILDDTSKPRSLRPNDDNYEAFVGPQWIPQQSTNLDASSSIHPAMAALLQSDSDRNTVYPRYDRCANCTQPATLQCAKCKIVKYCCRDPCQAEHWKKVHKQSCCKAHESRSLWQCLHGSDGFYVGEEECLALQAALGRACANDSFQDKDVLQCFQAYFGTAAELGGCFVL